jgi:hypothetical protein
MQEIADNKDMVSMDKVYETLEDFGIDLSEDLKAFFEYLIFR